MGSSGLFLEAVIALRLVLELERALACRNNGPHHFPPPWSVEGCDSLINAPVDFLIFPQRSIDAEFVVGDNDLHRIIPGEGGDHACLSTRYVSCSHRSYDERRLLDITSTSVAIIGLCSRNEYSPRCEDLAEPPHYRPVHCRRSRLQVRGVL